MVKVLLEFGAKPNVHHLLSALNAGLNPFPDTSMFPLLHLIITEHAFSATTIDENTHKSKTLRMRELKAGSVKLSYLKWDNCRIELIHGHWRWVDSHYNTTQVDADMLTNCKAIAERTFGLV